MFYFTFSLSKKLPLQISKTKSSSPADTKNLSLLSKRKERESPQGINTVRYVPELSQPQLHYKSIQPNITKVGFDMKMTLHHQHPPLTTYFHQELNVCNISAVNYPILT